MTFADEFLRTRYQGTSLTDLILREPGVAFDSYEERRRERAEAMADIFDALPLDQVTPDAYPQFPVFEEPEPDGIELLRAHWGDTVADRVQHLVRVGEMRDEEFARVLDITEDHRRTLDLIAKATEAAIADFGQRCETLVLGPSPKCSECGLTGNHDTWCPHWRPYVADED